MVLFLEMACLSSMACEANVTANVVLRQKGELVVVVSKARGLPALVGRYHVTVQAGSMNQQKTDALNAPNDAINLPAGSTFTMEWPHKAQRTQKVTKATEVVICLWRCATAFCLADGSRLEAHQLTSCLWPNPPVLLHCAL